MGIIDSIREKARRWKDKQEFLTMVDDETKGIRRRAYLEQARISAIEEGKELAKKDSNTRIGKIKKKEPEDFGVDIGKGLEDPFKFINGKGGKKK